MKKIKVMALAMATIFFTSCGGGSEGSGGDSGDVPADREITPDNIGDSPVSAKNLSEQMVKQTESVGDQEIGLIVHNQTGNFFGEKRGLNDRSGVGGHIKMRVSLNPEDQDTIIKASAEYSVFVLKGKIEIEESRFGSGTPMLMDARFVRVYEDTVVPSDRKIAYSEMSPDNPVSVSEFLASSDPWKGKEVTITDICKPAMNGNVVRFYKPGQEDKKLFDKEYYVNAVFSESWRDRDNSEAVYTIKGKVREFNKDGGTVELEGCSWIE